MAKHLERKANEREAANSFAYNPHLDEDNSQQTHRTYGGGLTKSKKERLRRNIKSAESDPFNLEAMLKETRQHLRAEKQRRKLQLKTRPAREDPTSIDFVPRSLRDLDAVAEDAPKKHRNHYERAPPVMPPVYVAPAPPAMVKIKKLEAAKAAKANETLKEPEPKAAQTSASSGRMSKAAKKAKLANSLLRDAAPVRTDPQKSLCAVAAEAESSMACTTESAGSKEGVQSVKKQRKPREAQAPVSIGIMDWSSLLPKEARMSRREMKKLERLEELKTGALGKKRRGDGDSDDEKLKVQGRVPFGEIIDGPPTITTTPKLDKSLFPSARNFEYLKRRLKEPKPATPTTSSSFEQLREEVIARYRQHRHHIINSVPAETSTGHTPAEFAS
eukprot:NODE_1258_length_1615_cov_25.353129_g1123_i0.p1 GENE.NODE_1258_length_1615_cov_25.353129_g1123_i0~~NODE_1258_length_1615_cov_25.353129_g1123_i0.p1  ORF type:complete len:449 (+),score=99.53 NODE_1258_length_1615_cov_25.353129_g1123_i0:185-1348(+)